MPLNFILGHTDPLIEASASLGYGLSHHKTLFNLKDDMDQIYNIPSMTQNVDELYDGNYETELETDNGFGSFLSLHAALKVRLDYKIDLSLEAIGHLHKTDFLDGLSYDSADQDMVTLFLVGIEFEF
jgi:hypothetical protein